MTKKVLCLIVCLIFIPHQVRALSDKIYKELEVFTRIMELVDQGYVEDVDEHVLVEGAINGMLSSLDPHTIYLPPDMYRDFQSDTAGQYGGIGIEITIKDGVITVVSPIDDSPAYEAGIKAGDKIVKINGELTKGMTLIGAVHKMRGNTGKKVIISIWREGLNKPIDYTIERKIIKVKAVSYELLKDGYVYIRITSFQERVTDNFIKALKEIEKENGGIVKGIVLDLRDNPGGLFSEAVQVSDIFMDQGVIVSTRGRSHKVEVQKANKDDYYENTPLVVLVNQGSASASEIVAGALQDSKRAKLLGTTTFGKGTVQTLIDVGDKSALKLTIAKYYTPKGKSIDGEGIIPDVLLDAQQLNKDYPKKEGQDQPTIRDYQKQKAIEYIRRLL